MSTPSHDAPTDSFQAATRHTNHGGIAKWIRRLAIPIIIGWVAIIAVLNTIVPQLEEVGEMRSVSMSPDDAPSMIAMKRVGEVFEEFKSNSSVMVVLEGQDALGDEAHAYYDQIVDKL
ncbi:MMPL family transporter, partial [Mycolicibacterium sp. XJ870]